MLKVSQTEVIRIANLEEMCAGDPGAGLWLPWSLCLSVHVYRCTLVFTHQDMALIVTLSIPWEHLMNFSSLLWKKNKRLDHGWCRIDPSHLLVGVYSVCKISSNDEWNLKEVLHACSVQKSANFWISVVPGRHLAICPGPDLLNRAREAKAMGASLHTDVECKKKGGALDK